MAPYSTDGPTDLKSVTEIAREVAIKFLKFCDFSKFSYAKHKGNAKDFFPDFCVSRKTK